MSGLPLVLPTEHCDAATREVAERHSERVRALQRETERLGGWVVQQELARLRAQPGGAEPPDPNGPPRPLHAWEIQARQPAVATRPPSRPTFDLDAAKQKLRDALAARRQARERHAEATGELTAARLQLAEAEASLAALDDVDAQAAAAARDAVRGREGGWEPSEALLQRIGERDRAKLRIRALADATEAFAKDLTGEAEKLREAEAACDRASLEIARCEGEALAGEVLRLRDAYTGERLRLANLFDRLQATTGRLSGFALTLVRDNPALHSTPEQRAECRRAWTERLAEIERECEPESA